MDTSFDYTTLDTKTPTGSLEFIERPQSRSKTALRLRYESESRVILRQFGGLEGVRKHLGLSQRKICQLLLVDPSAWTRWCRDENKVPPHVVRSLQWYLMLENKDPAWSQWRELILKREPDPQLDRWRRDLEQRLKNTQSNLKNQVAEALPTQHLEFQAQQQQLKDENQRLAHELERQGIIGVGWKLLLLVNTLVLLIVAVRALI